MEINSFSLEISNVLLGLCKGSRLLYPYSENFAKKLGYELFRFEYGFKIDIAKVTPDAILISEKNGNTLIFEWTASESIYERKKNQIHNYIKITQDDLRTNLAIPIPATNLHDIVLIVPNTADDSYKSFLKEHNIVLPLLEFSWKSSPKTLLKTYSEFKGKSTEEFFSEAIKISRIPKYIEFSLDNISPQTIVHIIVTRILSMIIKGAGQFQTFNFCKENIRGWQYFSNEKQSSIVRASKIILKNLANTQIGKEIISKSSHPEFDWELVDKTTFMKRQKYYQKQVQNFINQTREKSIQQELDLI